MMKMMKDHGGSRLAEAVKSSYAHGSTDYYMEPLVRVDENGIPIGKIKNGDTVIFACRRGEREIELTEMFTDPAFDKAERSSLSDLNFVILTMYHEKFRDLPVAFAPLQVQLPLAEVVSKAGKSQLHCAESEKFAHITYFLNGGNSLPYPGEDDVCIPSAPGDPSKRPQLNLPKVVDAVTERLGKYDFVAVNFANGDIVGHTSDRGAKVEAAFYISSQLERLAEAAKKHDYVIAVTADHGNLEVMTTKDGRPNVAHTSNPVPFILIDPRSDAPISLQDGNLCDVAPTILHIMGIEKPREMTGSALAIEHDFKGARKVMLVILDGWGLGSPDETNAIFTAETKYWDRLVSRYPYAVLNASGACVGLSDGKAGNSEAGHLNLGAGRIVPQDDRRLDDAIADGSFAKNPVLIKAVEDTRKRGASLHIIAYLSKKSSHGSIDYSLEICKMAAGLPEVYLHIIFDGRSTVPGSAPEMLIELDRELEKIGTGKIADGVGRGLVLERNYDYEKVKQGYDAMVIGKGKKYS